MSTAKIMTMATPPVATVVTMLRTASGIPIAAVTGFHTGHSALVVCDSFGNAFVPYIAPYYDKVCLVDLRDSHDFVTGGGGAPLRDYIKEYDIDDVYFIVSRGTGINSDYMQYTVRKYL